MKLLITEEQVRLLMREFGERVSYYQDWLDGIYKLTSNPSFVSNSYEEIALGEDEEYLGYWDTEQNIGFVVNEYVDDNEDYDAFFGDELKLTDLV